MVVSAPTERAPGDGALPEHRSAGVLSAVVAALLGAATALPFYAVLQHQQAQGTSAAALGMPAMHMERMDVYWAFPILQATGIVALIWSYAGVALGLLESGNRPSWWLWSRATTNRTHRHISLVVLGLVLVHAVATAYDAMGDDWMTAFSMSTPSRREASRMLRPSSTSPRRPDGWKITLCNSAISFPP